MIRFNRRGAEWMLLMAPAGEEIGAAALVSATIPDVISLAEQSPRLRQRLLDEVYGMRDLLRRDWAVRVLDAWRSKTAERAWHMSGDKWAWVRLIDHTSGKYDQRGYDAETPDAARLAAAEAVWPELPESVRAELGERP